MGSYFLYLYKSSANKVKYKIFGTEEAVNNFVVELWLHLSIIQARLILHSVCTNLGYWLLAVGSSNNENENEDENLYSR